MDEDFAHEERLKLVQDVRVYPVGRVLRETFDADNHDTLGSDVTGLMINLARVPYEPAARGRGADGAARSSPRGGPMRRAFAWVTALMRRWSTRR